MRELENNLPSIDNCLIAIIGLGYVGLPLACEFAKTTFCKKTGKKLNRNVFGFDLNSNRINQLIDGIDLTNEVNEKELKNTTSLKFTNLFNLFMNYICKF